jgi:hypothetical protein
MGRLTVSHRRLPPRGAAALLLVLALAGTALLRPADVRGQLQTGNLYGVVTAPDGAPLPGVTVTLTGQGAPQVQVTDAAGRFRFLGLAPGSYQLAAELEGFRPIDYPNIVINIGRNTEIEVTLTPDTLAMDDPPVSMGDPPVSDGAPVPAPPAATEPPAPTPTPALPPALPPLALTFTRGGAAVEGGQETTPRFRVLGRIEVCWEVDTIGFGSTGVPEISLVFVQLLDPESQVGRGGPTARQGSLEQKSGTGCATLDLPAGTYYLEVSNRGAWFFSYVIRVSAQAVPR